MKVMKKFKMKPIKLGTIRDYDTPIKPKSNVVWDFDKTLAIFIRDGLRKLAEITCSCPYRFVETYANTIPDDDKDKAQKVADYDGTDAWKKELRDLANKFDAYIHIYNSYGDEETRVLNETKEALNKLKEIFFELWD